MEKGEFIARTEKLLKEITYKPKWRFSVASSPDWLSPTAEVRIFMRVPDVITHIEGDVAYPVFFQMDRDWSDEEIVHKVMWGVKTLETHEIREWFKWKGVNVEDPHPELKNPSLLVPRLSD